MGNFTLLMFLALALVACGGGGDGPDPSSVSATPASPIAPTDAPVPTITITQTPTPTPTPNLAPSVDAGPDRQLNEKSLVTLEGVASDEEGEITAYQWTQLDGVPVSIEDSGQLAASFLAPNVDEVTVLSFELTVTDNDNARSSDSVAITVNPTLDVTVTFPAQFNAYPHDLIDVVGYVSHVSGETNVEVEIGGTSVTATPDENGRWRAKDINIAANDGAATLNVRASDAAGFEESKQLYINNELEITDASNFIYDSAAKIYYLWNPSSRTIFSVNRSTGEKNIVLDESSMDSGSLGLSGLKFDSDSSNIISVRRNSVVRIDPVTRALVELAEIHDLGVGVYVVAYDYDDESNTIYALINRNTENDSYNEIVEVNIGENRRRIVSGLSVGEGDLLRNLSNIALSLTNNRLYSVSRREETLISINIETGDREIVSSADVGDGDTRFLSQVYSYAAIDESTQTLYVAGVNSRKYYKIDLASGDRTILESDINEHADHARSNDILLSRNSEPELHILTRDPLSIFTIQLENGEAEKIDNKRIASTSPIFDVYNLYYQADLNRLLLQKPVLNDRESVASLKLEYFDLQNHDNQLLIESFPHSLNSGGVFSNSLIYSHEYYFDFNRYDLSSGETYDVSDALNGNGPIFSNPVRSFTVNQSNIYAFDIDSNDFIRINIDTGDRELLSEGRGTPHQFSRIIAMRYNPSNDLLYVLAYSDRYALYTIDAVDGTRNLLIDVSAIDERYRARGAQFDQAFRNIYSSSLPGSAIGNGTLQRLDLETYEMMTISDNDGVGSGVWIDSPNDLILDENHERLFLNNSDNILMIDIETGNRVSILKRRVE